MPDIAEDWNCPKCTGLNPLAATSCWNCQSPRPTNGIEDAPRPIPPSETKSSVRHLLIPHLGKTIAINAMDPTKLEPAILAAVHGEYFTVSCQAGRQTFHFPYRYMPGVNYPELSATTIVSGAAWG